MSNNDLANAPLGQKSAYITRYQPDLLFPIARSANREKILSSNELPFQGADIWNAYEVSWLNAKGKPIVATAEFIIPCTSPNIIEAKSFKLYLNSFNNTSFDSVAQVEKLLAQDLSNIIGKAITVKLTPSSQAQEKIAASFNGTCLDELDVSCDTYTLQPTYLTTENQQITETIYSNLLKSNCMVTGQPDWGSIQIHYTGKKINHANLLKYIVSFRNHIEFSEPCVERIFMDITTHCAPEKLFVYARYTRRGGLDINPYRANFAVTAENVHLWRQ